MTNPFEQLKSKVKYEEVEGSFTCQHRGCWEVVHEARYIKKEKLLTWKCPNEHVSSTEIELE